MGAWDGQRSRIAEIERSEEQRARRVVPLHGREHRAGGAHFGIQRDFSLREPTASQERSGKKTPSVGTGGPRKGR